MIRLATTFSIALATLVAACSGTATEMPSGADVSTSADAASDTALVAPDLPVVGPGVDVTTTDTSDVQVPPTGCGDGVVVAPEGCDEGPKNGLYGHCDDACQGVGLHCGDGIISSSFEQCDDGALNGTYGLCDYGCKGNGARCGDGAIQPAQESCDDGAKNGKPGFCPETCLLPLAGCGDGDVNPPELCDDGKANGSYGHCAGDCSGAGPSCGDGIADVGVEVCDHGAQNGTYGRCSTDCKGLGPHCGDGTIDSPDERCDDGPTTGASGACAKDCQGLASPWMVEPQALATPVPDGTTCAEGDLLAKYMQYRRRLRGDGTAAYPGFVVLGDGEGHGLVASRREPGENCAGHWSLGSCPVTDLPDAQGIIRWGDGTIWLGEHLGTIALEYAMFKDLGISLDETARDLRDLLTALDRVDLRAEAFYPGATPALDGLFVRDDVPQGFTVLPDGGYRFPRSGANLGYECVTGDIICETPVITDGSFTSQDQVVALVFGLTMIAGLVPDEVVVDGMAIRQAARERVHRLVWFLHSHGWRVTDPNGEHPPDQWGGSALGFSDHLAITANAVCGHDFGVDDYRNLTSRTVGQSAWAGLQAVWWSTKHYNRTMALRLAATTGVWEPSKMASQSMGDGKDYFAMAYAVLRGVPLPAPFSEWRIDALLRSAPCGGPCRDTEGCTNARGWQGESRTISPQERIGGFYNPPSEFNGLDYMGLFAAWHLTKHGLWQVKPAVKPPATCGGVLSLDTILAGSFSSGATYDPASPCAGLELQRPFCGRPFGAWVDDATRGKVSLYLGGARWSCPPGAPCTLTKSTLESTNGDDLIVGTSGNDSLSGDSGNDCLVGLGGDDDLRGNQGFDWLNGGDGNDQLYGESGGLLLDGDGDVLIGGSGNDFLRGGPGQDELDAGDGDDELDGGDNRDYLLGGLGNDTMKGGADNDVLIGGPGDDSLIGEGGDDMLEGNDGRDKLDGEGGDDALRGGLGPDFLRGGTGMDSLDSGDQWTPVTQLAHDRLCGNGGDDTLWGGWDGDECLGGGWFFGGTDTVQGCDDGTAKEGDCDNGGFDAW